MITVSPHESQESCIMENETKFKTTRARMDDFTQCGSKLSDLEGENVNIVADGDNIMAEIAINIKCPACGEVLTKTSDRLVCFAPHCRGRVEAYEIPTIELTPVRWR